MPLSVILLLFPLLASFILLIFSSRSAGSIAMASAVVEVSLTVITLLKFIPGPNAQFLCDMVWIKDMGINFSLGIDGISILFIVLTNFILFTVILLTLNYNYSKYFYILLLITQSALLGVFMAFDALLFYFFWEVALIPMYFLISYWGDGSNKLKITFKFFCYTMLGSLLMLFGIIYIKTVGGGFDILSFYKAGLNITSQKWLFWTFFIAFAIKIPIFPFHSWQRDTYVSAPFAGSIILCALMLKMGIYGSIRWMMPIFSDAIESLKILIVILCVINIIYGAVSAIKRKNIKALIAYSSLSHVGLIFLGVLILSFTSLEGALFQSFNHGLVATALFAVAQIIYRRLKTHNINDIGGGLSVCSRLFTFCFFTMLLSSIAFPLTGGFIGEFILLKSVYDYSPVVAFISVLSVILGAVYSLRLFKKTMLGENLKNIDFEPLRINEGLALLFLVFGTIAIGVYPTMLTDLIDPSVKNLLYLIQFIKSSS